MLIDEQYKDLIREVLDTGRYKEDRTGVGCWSIAGAQIKHDMSEGFPLLTIRKVPYRSVRVELEGFIKGIDSKKWYQDRQCGFWTDWCNPKKVPYSNDKDTKARMAAEDDLGIIYGNNWRDFHDPVSRLYGEGSYGYVDQLKNLVNTLKKDPNSRRMLVTAWNPLALDYAALPACHYSWQVTVIGGRLNLIFTARSTDILLGLPANIASYATLLHLLALESGLEPGVLVGQIGADAHLYNNHLGAAREYLTREPFKLPQIETKGFTNIFDWTYDQTKVIDYIAHERIKVDVAV